MRPHSARLRAAIVAVPMTCLACGGSPPPPPAPPPAANHPVERDADPPAATPDVASTADTLQLVLTDLRVAPDQPPNEPTADDVGRFLGVRFMPDAAACVGIPTKIKGMYVPAAAPPNELEGMLVLAPDLTLDELTACYLAMGGKRSAIRSPGPAVRAFPGFSLAHEAFFDLGHGWLFAASDLDRGVLQLAHQHAAWLAAHPTDASPTRGNGR